MMNARPLLLLLLLGLLILPLAWPARSQSGIIVNNADAVRETGASLNPNLGTVTASVRTRVVLQSANAGRHEALGALPAALQALFTQVRQRIVLQAANTARHETLGALPAELQSIFMQVGKRIVSQAANALRHANLTAPDGTLQALFAGVANRIVLQSANAGRQETLVFPREIIGDTTSPQISNVVLTRVGASIRVTWTTNEFANSTVLYGTQPGSYPFSVTNTLYDRQHELYLTGLRGGATVYLRVRSADLSGNTATGGERSIVAGGGVYLPYVTGR
jgi:hypothetical protein